MTDFEIMRDGDQARIVLGEKLTAVEIPMLQPVLKEEISKGTRRIIFDMTQTVSIDSTGIGLLIAANNSLEPLTGEIHLINVSPDILKLLRSMRLLNRLHAVAAENEVSHG
jgi:anti-anti-sigma factor